MPTGSSLLDCCCPQSPSLRLLLAGAWPSGSLAPSLALVRALGLALGAHVYDRARGARRFAARGVCRLDFREWDAHPCAQELCAHTLACARAHVLARARILLLLALAPELTLVALELTRLCALELTLLLALLHTLIALELTLWLQLRLSSWFCSCSCLPAFFCSRLRQSLRLCRLARVRSSLAHCACTHDFARARAHACARPLALVQARVLMLAQALAWASIALPSWAHIALRGNDSSPLACPRSACLSCHLLVCSCLCGRFSSSSAWYLFFSTQVVENIVIGVTRASRVRRLDPRCPLGLILTCARMAL